VGTIILSLMSCCGSWPAFRRLPRRDGSGDSIQHRGIIGRGLEVIFAPLGFNWQISVALVPGLAAREVAVSALAPFTPCLRAAGDLEGALLPVIANSWSIATGLSLLAWYVFAPQCLSTLSVVKRETNSWRYPLLMAVIFRHGVRAHSLLTRGGGLGAG